MGLDCPLTHVAFTRITLTGTPSRFLCPVHPGFFSLCEPINSSLASWHWVLTSQWETAEDRQSAEVQGNTSHMMHVYHRASGKAKCKMLTLSLSIWGHQQQGCPLQQSKEHSRSSGSWVSSPGSKLGSMVTSARSPLTSPHLSITPRFASPRPALSA